LLQGAIFDIDGTLVDSNDAHAQPWVDAFSEAGYYVPLARVRAIAFHSRGWTNESLSGAAEIYDGAAYLPAQYESSIIGRESK